MSCNGERDPPAGSRYVKLETFPERLAEAEAVIRDLTRQIDEIAFTLGCRDENCDHEECIAAQTSIRVPESIARLLPPIRERKPAEPFHVHRDHDWFTADGTYYCEDCHIDMTPPTDAEKEDFFKYRFGISPTEYEKLYGKKP